MPISAEVRAIPAIVLVGGLGKRLAGIAGDVPKPMAPIGGRPFLEIVIDHLIAQGIREVVLSVGHKREVIQKHFGSCWRGLQIRYCIEERPLGTGGAIKKAFDETKYRQAFVLNGDTYCPVDLSALQAAHLDARLTLTLKRVEDVARFGSVVLDADGRVRAFREKSVAAGTGMINAGIYLLERDLLRLAPDEPEFSFETDIMQEHFSAVTMRGYVTDAMFIDIGIPSELRRAQALFA